MEKKDKFLFSLIVPVYKQAATIAANIAFLEQALEKLSFDYELIVVVDGFCDDTYKIAKKLESRQIKVLGYEKNHGKGYAVRYGMLKAKGDVIGFIDAGMDINPESIAIAFDFMKLHNADIIVGSKLHPDSVVNYPIIRRILSWGYRTLIEVLFGFAIRDTQVGLKIFKRKVVKDVFPRLVVKRFAFDIEILTVAYALGYHNIHEAPIKLEFNWGSSISSKNFWKVIISMLWDTAAVFYRLKILRYYTKNKKKP